MTRPTFNTGFAMLLKAYAYARQQENPETQEVYWMMLHALPDDLFNSAIQQCLAECKFFPTIAEIGEAALPKKKVLSDYKVETRNGFDRVWIELGWESQIRELENEKRISDGRPVPRRLY